MRLQARYSTTILALVVTVIICLSFTLLIQFRAASALLTQTSAVEMADDLLQQMHQRGATMSRNLAEILINPVYIYDMEKIQQLLQPSINDPDVLSIEVYDLEGGIISDGSDNISSFGYKINDDKVIRAISNKEKLYTRLEEDKIVFAYPLWVGDTALGGVRLTFSLNSINNDIAAMEKNLQGIYEGSLRRNAYTIAFVALILIGVGIVMAIITSGSLIKPIKKLVVYAGQVGHGSYDVSIDINRADELGELANAFEDMSKNLQQSTNEIRHLAYHDALTGLPNRLALREHLKYMLPYAKRDQQKIAVLFIDLDDFKRVNDTLGHDIGDQLLKKVSERLKKSIRGSDVVSLAERQDEQSPVLSRLGGDEFTLVLMNIRESFDAAIIANRIIKSLSKHFELPGQEVVIGASIGITIFPDDGDSIDTLLKNADIAMYHAKESGKNAYQYFASSMNSGVQKKLEIEAELRYALQHDQLMLHYQPQVDMRTGKLYGAEALIRWQHPDRGMVSPIEFIPVAEQTGLIHEIGKWVIRKASEDIKKWSELYEGDYWVSINVSSIQFRRQKMVDVFKTILGEVGLEPHKLHIEVTETSLIYSEEQTAKTLNELRKIGLKVWMDDFGTGFSSLSYLRRFPLDGVKIDRSFIKEIQFNTNDLALTRAIIAMAHGLGLSVIAEGVETLNQLKLLKNQDCDICQGFLFSKPLEPKEFEKILSYGKIELPKEETPSQQRAHPF